MKILRKFYSYLKKDFLLLYKRKKYLYLFIMLPLVIGFIFLMALNPTSYNINLGVCDFDDTQISNAAYNGLQGFNPVIFEEENCTENLKRQISLGNIDLGLEIENGFSKNIENLKQSHINIYYDNTDISFSNLVAWKVDQSLSPFKREIINSLNNELNEKASSIRGGVEVLLDFSSFSKTLDDKVNKIDEDLQKLEELDTEFLINPIWTNKISLYEDSLKKDAGIVFIFPILVLFITLMLASTSIIYDKNTNFITRVKASSNPFIYLLAKTIFFTFLVFAQFLVLLIIFMFYGGSYIINFIEIIKLLLFIGIIDTLIGFTIGLIAKNEGIAVLFSLMVSFPLMLISGIFFPIQALPSFTQWISKILPLEYQINSAKSVLLFGQQMTNNWIWFALGLFVLVYYLIRKN